MPAIALLASIGWKVIDRFHFGSRFAVSPLFELSHLLRKLAGVDTRLPRDWSARLRPTFRRLHRPIM